MVSAAIAIGTCAAYGGIPHADGGTGRGLPDSFCPKPRHPGNQGFDEWFGFLAGCVDYYSHIFYYGANQPGPGVNPTHDLWEDGEEVPEELFDLAQQAENDGDFQNAAGREDWNGWTSFDATLPTFTYWQVSNYGLDDPADLAATATVSAVVTCRPHTRSGSSPAMRREPETQ